MMMCFTTRRNGSIRYAKGVRGDGGDVYERLYNTSEILASVRREKVGDYYSLVTVFIAILLYSSETHCGSQP